MMRSNPKTPDVVMMMIMIMMVMLMGRVALLINDALNGAKLIHVAGNGDGTLLIEAVLFLGLFEELHEERVIDVDHRYHEPLLLLSLRPHHNCQAPLWDTLQFLMMIMIFLLMMIMMMMMKKVVNVRDLQVKVDHVVVFVFLTSTDRH